MVHKSVQYKGHTYSRVVTAQNNYSWTRVNAYIKSQPYTWIVLAEDAGALEAAIKDIELTVESWDDSKFFEKLTWSGADTLTADELTTLLADLGYSPEHTKSFLDEVRKRGFTYLDKP